MFKIKGNECLIKDCDGLPVLNTTYVGNLQDDEVEYALKRLRKLEGQGKNLDLLFPLQEYF